MPSAVEYKNMGNEYFKAGNHGKAIEYYTYATEMDPNNHLFMTNRAAAYAKMGKWEKSLRDATKALKIKSDWHKGFWRVGDAHLALGDAQAALKAYESAHRLMPDNANYKKLMKKAEDAFLADKSRADILKLEGNKMFKQGKIEEAIAEYTKALKACKPEEKKLKSAIYSNRAMCNQQLYKPTEIIKDCTAAIELDPANIKAYVRRAGAYESMERYKDAMKDFQQANLMAPSMEVAYKGLSRVRQAMKRNGDAKAY